MGTDGPLSPESVKDLIRYLRHEDETRDVRQQLGAAQILQNDLLPILVQYPQDKVLFDAVIRYLWPGVALWGLLAGQGSLTPLHPLTG